MIGSSFPDRPSLRSQIPFTVNGATVEPYPEFGPSVGAEHPADNRATTKTVEETTARMSGLNSVMSRVLTFEHRSSD